MPFMTLFCISQSNENCEFLLTANAVWRISAVQEEIVFADACILLAFGIRYALTRYVVLAVQSNSCVKTQEKSCYS